MKRNKLNPAICNHCGQFGHLEYSELVTEWRTLGEGIESISCTVCFEAHIYTCYCQNKKKIWRVKGEFYT